MILGGLIAGALAAEPRPGEAPLTVLAASSLSEVLVAVGQGWVDQGHPAPIFAFDASSRLARQVEAGAPADVFVSADAAWMDHLEARGRIDPTTRVDLAGNRLVVVVPGAGAHAVTAPTDLASPAVRHLALAGESVPAGRYARAALDALGVWPAVRDRVVAGDDVRSALAWVAAGDAEAGVVYATDARVEPRVRVAFPVPPAAHPPVVYPGAVVVGALRPDLARDFLTYCGSGPGRTWFVDAGFLPPPGPSR